MEKGLVMVVARKERRVALFLAVSRRRGAGAQWISIVVVVIFTRPTIVAGNSGSAIPIGVPTTAATTIVTIVATATIAVVVFAVNGR